MPLTAKYLSQELVDLVGALGDLGNGRIALYRCPVHADRTPSLPGGGRFHLTPFYGVLAAQPSADRNQVPHKTFQLAMSVGGNRKYRIADIHGRHFVESWREARLGPAVIRQALAEVRASAEQVRDQVKAVLPRDFPAALHASVQAAIGNRFERLGTAEI